MKPCIIDFKVVFITMFMLYLVASSSESSYEIVEPTVTFFTLNNITAPVCTRQHLCRNTGCSTNQTFPQFCHCDDACTYFGDCCIDYKESCSIDVDQIFQTAVITRQIKRADFICEITNVEDNESYWMVSKCDKDLGLVSERCENPICNDTLSNIPVTDSSGISYRNVYCAVCHNVETSKLTAWKATYDCPSVVLLDQYAFDISQVCSECSFTLRPAPPTLPTRYLTSARRCEPYMIVNCRDEADDSCGVYTAVIEAESQIFKNPHCYACGHPGNGQFLDLLNCEGVGIPNINIDKIAIAHLFGKSFEDPLPDEQVSNINNGNTGKGQFEPLLFDESYENFFFSHIETRPDDQLYFNGDRDQRGSEFTSMFIPAPVSVPLSVVLDFGSSLQSSVKIFHNQEIIKETIISCPDGQVYLGFRGSGNCVYLSCPKGFSLRDGDCLPGGPSDRASPCANKNFNSTFILKASIGTSIKSCQNASFTNVSKEFLVHLFGHNVYTEWSTICEGVFEDTVNVTYSINGTTDLFEFVQDILDKTNIWNSIVYTARTSKALRQVEILRSCLNLDMEYSCDSDWLSENEYIIRSTNGSQEVFLNSTAKLQTTDGVLFRVRYRSRNATLGYTKNTEVKICHGNNYLSCAFVTMNRSFFEDRDFTNGTLKYIPDGRMFNSSEYMITSDDEILVCNFLNQTAIVNVTEIVTFFEYSNAQTIVSIIGSILSLVAILLTCITYTVFPSLRNRASRLIMNLVVALFTGQLLLLFGGNSAQNESVCFATAVLAHYSWLAAFAWMNVLAFDLNRTFGNPDNLRIMSQGNKSMIWYLIYAWGMPLFIVIPCIAVHFCQCTTIRFKYGNINTCWITDGTANLLTFGSPAGIFLLFNVALFGHTVAGIRSTKKATARIQDTSMLKRSRKELIIYIKVCATSAQRLMVRGVMESYCLVCQTIHSLARQTSCKPYRHRVGNCSQIASLMGFTWIFGYFAAFTGFEALWYIYIILNSLQGLFIFMSFIFNRRVGLLWANKLNLSSFVASTPKTMSSEGTKKRYSSASGTDTTRYYSNSYARNPREHSIGNNGSTQPLQDEAKV